MRKLAFFTILWCAGCCYSCNREESHPTDYINPAGDNLADRIAAPAGYAWVREQENSFASFLQHLPLLPAGSPVLDHIGNPIPDQQSHVAVINYDVGTKNLQQCADAVIRLRAEYLYAQQRFSEIAFHFTSGHLFAWDQYKNGYRPNVRGNQVSFHQTGAVSDSYNGFRNYLDVVFTYAGTISLYKETRQVTSNAHIKPGDVLITAGSPGHAVIIVGRAKKQNKMVYLLAQSFMPAQSIHILTNPGNALNPWYELDVHAGSTHTARYTFTPTRIRSFE